MEKGSEGCKMPVEVTHSKETMAVFHACLQFSLKRWVAARVRAGGSLATQAVHRRKFPSVNGCLNHYMFFPFSRG